MIYDCVYVSGRRYFSSLNLFMPPFGREPGEKDAKPLPFLSLSNASKPRRRATPAGRAFAPEGAERCDGLEAPAATVRSKQELSKVRHPFQDEPGEVNLDKTVKRPKKEGSLTKQPFQDEFAEDGLPASDDSDDSPKDYESKSQSVFSLGWQSMLTLQKAGFWKDHKDDGQPPKKKRTYDNSKRSSEALYLQKDAGSVFRKRGSDEPRLKLLFQEQSCRCAMTANKSFLLSV